MELRVPHSAHIGGFLTVLFLSVTLGLLSPSAQAQEPNSCETEYEHAQEQYYAAEFDAAINLLQQCLQRANLSVETRVQGYRLLSFAYIAQGNRQQARYAVERLLDVQPDYTPDPSQDRPDFVELVREVKASRQPATASEPEGNRRWVKWTLGGVGVAAAGVLATVLLGGGDNGGLSDLPGNPPPPPNSQ